jgi:citrate synthase
VNATAFKPLLQIPKEFAPWDENEKVPLMMFDPGFKNTVICRSSISKVDGTSGKLFYRGYDIQVLFEKSTFMETAYLLIYGELPDAVTRAS